MPTPVQWLLSLLFVAQMYLAMLLYAIWWTPFVLVNRDNAHRAAHAYCRWVRLSAKWIVGLDSEVRGTPPTGECVVAAKHQSFFDIIIVFSAMPRPKFIMKKELVWAPILGWYALKMGCVPVDRGKRGQAIAQMKARVMAGADRPGQLVIYPQGTRVAPGRYLPYKVGTGILYDQLAQPCVPVAVNVGVFWPKRSILRRRGTAVVEFLPQIAPGLAVPDFMQAIEAAIEPASDRLMAEAGFRP
jgi:1-acyl-sn-glycerol-3-phosphate acyltransferase